MIDGEGALGDADEAKRKVAVENHYKWVEAAKFLGCHSIRVNAQSTSNYEEAKKLAADGLRRLSEFAAQHEHWCDRRKSRWTQLERQMVG